MITFEDGFWIQYAVDVGCLEVQTKPASVTEFTSRRTQINQFIFGSAKSQGLTVDKMRGGGHINIDQATGFEGKEKLFRNFIVDRANHPELAWGIFGETIRNGPPLASLGPEPIYGFHNVITDFDEKITRSGFFRKTGDDAIFELARDIEQRVYIDTPGNHIWPDSNNSTTYYQELGLRNISKYTKVAERRVEVRSLRPQINFSTFLLQIQFFDARLTYLDELDELIPIDIPEDINMSKEEKISRFRAMLKEMKIQVNRYDNILRRTRTPSFSVTYPTFTPEDTSKGNCLGFIRAMLRRVAF